MVKKAFENGAIYALKQFGLEKIAISMMPTIMAKGRQFLRGQAGGLGQLGQGLQGMLGPTANPAARGQAWQGLKALAPTGAALGTGYLLSRGGDEPQQQQRPPQLY